MTDALAGEIDAQVAKAQLGAAQWALAHRGEVVAGGTIGAADDALFVMYSATKALMASLVWVLVQDGRLDVQAAVAQYVPAFGHEPLSTVRVEQLLTHTAGFPNATMDPLTWADPRVRAAQLVAISLEWPPGARFCYHASSSMWVLAEVIEGATGMDYRDAMRRWVLTPLGLDGQLFLGLPERYDDRVATVRHVGAPPAPKRLASLGISLKLDTPEYRRYLESFNSRAMRARGVPSGGAVGTAAGMALFYQALLGFRQGAPWRRATIDWALAQRTGELVDPMTGKLARRALGVIVAGDSDKHFRGFGVSCSAATFGHPGAGGQVAWADPERDLSFVFLTSGLDRDPIRQGVRMVRLSTLAASSVNIGAT